jgi:hypothetical protein
VIAVRPSEVVRTTVADLHDRLMPAELDDVAAALVLAAADRSALVHDLVESVLGLDALAALEEFGPE